MLFLCYIRIRFVDVNRQLFARSGTFGPFSPPFVCVMRFPTIHLAIPVTASTLILTQYEIQRIR